MKHLVLLVTLLFLSLTTQAQQLQKLTSLSANTAANILAASAVVDAFSVVNSTTNNATINFYDSSTTATNFVQAEYTSYSSYATNFTVVWTNTAGSLVTNTFAGIYTAPTVNTVSTNNRALVTSLVIPPSSTLSKDVRLQVMRGLTAQANQAVTLITTYRNPQ